MANTFTITEYDGLTTNNYPVQIGRPFTRGEITTFPQVVLNGSAITTQADVKSRWDDNSVKHAIISFLVPTLSANTIVSASFQSQSTGNNSAYLSEATMLSAAFNFNAIMELTSSASVMVSASARSMLDDANFTYWTSGAICTTVIIADHSINRLYDIGFDGHKSFRPIFQASFWPTINKVKVRFIGEVCNSQRLQDMYYSLVLKTSATPAAQVYSKSIFFHWANSRWTKEYWINGTPSDISINHNFAYLTETKFFANYDTSITVTSATLAAQQTSWNSASKDIYDAGLWNRNMPNTGGRPDIGPHPNWTIYWLYMGDIHGTGGNERRLKDVACAQAELAGGWPMHYREGRNDKWFDRTSATPGIGRVLSVTSRPSITLYSHSNSYFNYGNTAAVDRVSAVSPIAEYTTNPWKEDVAHQPQPFYTQYLLTGDFFYLEQQWFWASWSTTNTEGDATNNYRGRGPTGAEGVLFGWAERAQAWCFRNRVEAVFCSPDIAPEKTYFNQLTEDCIAAWEGGRGISGTGYYHNSLWEWGYLRIKQMWLSATPPPAPMRNWIRMCANLGDGCAGDEQILQTSAVEAEATFMQFFNYYSLGLARDFGYATSALINWFGPWIIEMICGPGANPYMIGTYRMPVARYYTLGDTNSGRRYYSSMAELQTGWEPQVVSATSWARLALASPGNPLDLDHGYALIVQTGLTYTTHLTSGLSAMDWADQHVWAETSFTQNPKWAILPRTVSVEDGDGDDVVITLGNLYSISRRITFI